MKARGVAAGEIVAEMRAAAFFASERGGDDEMPAGVQVAELDAPAVKGDGDGAANRSELGLSGTQTFGIAEQAGFFPHDMLDALAQSGEVVLRARALRRLRRCELRKRRFVAHDFGGAGTEDETFKE